eukprot:6039146-Pyramimonas_sp.AAC.1
MAPPPPPSSLMHRAAGSSDTALTPATWEVGGNSHAPTTPPKSMRVNLHGMVEGPHREQPLGQEIGSEKYDAC